MHLAVQLLCFTTKVKCEMVNAFSLTSCVYVVHPLMFPLVFNRETLTSLHVNIIFLWLLGDLFLFFFGK